MPSPAALALGLVRLTTAALLLGLAVAADLAPLVQAQRGWTMPDLLLCTVACIVARRPQMLPSWLVLVAGLARDLLSGAPVGPATAALLIGAEYMRPRPDAARRPGFGTEWLRLAVVAAGAVLLPTALLWIGFAAVPDATSLALRWATTVAAYPMVAMLLRIGRAPRAGRQEERRA